METVVDLISLAHFLTASVGSGRTQEEIAEHFRSSTRTVQRWLKALADWDVDLRCELRGRSNVYRVHPRAAFDRPSFRNSRAKTLRLAELRILARAMDDCGWSKAACRHRDHADHLLSGEAQANRKEIEREVARLLERVECSPTFGADPVPWSHLVDCIHMAILAGREVHICLPGQKLIGLVSRVVYQGGAGEVWLEDGQKTDLGAVQNILGLGDLEQSILKAA